MMTLPDFEKKQMIFVYLINGEKISFKNDNIIVETYDGTIRLQTTCYRIFALFIIGSFTLTTGLIQRAQKFTFPIFLMTQSTKVFDKLGYRMQGNVLLRQHQYNYQGLELATHIVKNKIANQLEVLKQKRKKDDLTKESINKIENFVKEISLFKGELHELLGIEGNAAKIYFKAHFDNIEWNGRKPRIKFDYVNSALDIGYSILFNILESMLDIYGFDVFCGVLHRQFYMRKSLVCDIIEPFRIIIDTTIKKAINLGQIKEIDFEYVNGGYQLKWNNNKKYVKLFIENILKHKNDIFVYVQSYYRAFMKGKPAEKFPIFYWRECS